MNTELKAAIMQSADSFAESVDLRKITENGVSIDPLEYDFLYGYPPLSALPPVADASIVLSRKRPKTIALYLHLPFCSYACSFCYFVKRCRAEESFIRDYLKVLATEIEAVAVWLNDVTVTSVYFGGGTPTCLSTQDLMSLVDLVSGQFKLADDYEWTVEASPETTTQEKILAMVRNGVNRISLGVQTFHEDVNQKLFRRGHSLLQTINSIDTILSSGVPRHNVDLIHGYPGQSRDHLWHEFDMIEHLALRSVTWYQLWQRMDTVIRRHAINVEPVSPELVLEIKSTIVAAMAHLGFHRDKIDWFIKDECDAQRQQDEKWSGGSFVGTGLSAYGYVDGYYYRNHTSFESYSARVQSLGLGIGQGWELAEDQVVKRALMLGIKRAEGVPVDLISRCPSPIRKDILLNVNSLCDAALISTNDGRIRLTEIGQALADNVARALCATECEASCVSQWRDYSGTPPKFGAFPDFGDSEKLLV